MCLAGYFVEEKQKLYLNKPMYLTSLLSIYVEEKQKLYLNKSELRNLTDHCLVEEKQKLYLNIGMLYCFIRYFVSWRETKVVFKLLFCI